MEIIGRDLSGPCFVGHCRVCGAVLKAMHWEIDTLNDGWGNAVAWKGSCVDCAGPFYFYETTEAKLETLRD